ncbi:hypothetical protein FH972_005946 [Carpinus fangiana]|uniref:F-box domain-containing protein n=1 Tax=Carpinus fangiana TaxID=176857 RepID=A0A5N6QR47_9ROSI|nr:hypothetical protein FH972_005946 [Carpinus fangiana]
MEQPIMIKKQNSDGRDVNVGFIDLPDEVVHHILNLQGAELRDLARLSMVSKRCRELCISTPNLLLSNIDTDDKFKSFVDKFMALRCLHGVWTVRFQIRWSFDEADAQADQYRAVETWLQRAVASGGGVANVRLQFIHLRKASQSQSQSHSFALPLCVMRCNSLRFLEVDAGNGVLKLPSPPYFATKLRMLILSNVKIENDSNIGALFSSFKSLEVLWFDNVSGIKSMSISSSSLQILSITSFDSRLCDIDIQQVDKLHDLNLLWHAKPCTAAAGRGGSRRSLTISAPNLRKFHFSGFAVDHYCMSEAPHLWQATIALLLRGVNQAAANKNNLDKILHSVKKATNLTIGVGFEEGMSPREQQHSLKMEDWESQNLMFTHQLKTVTVKLFDGVKEIELIKYLLKNAQELQAIVILYTSPMSSDFLTDELTKYKKPSTKWRLYSTSSYILNMGRVFHRKMVQ